MLLRKPEEYLLWKLGQMLKEQKKLAPALQDRELMALIKTVMSAVRQQRKVRPGSGWGRRRRSK